MNKDNNDRLSRYIKERKRNQIKDKETKKENKNYSDSDSETEIIEDYINGININNNNNYEMLDNNNNNNNYEEDYETLDNHEEDYETEKEEQNILEEQHIQEEQNISEEQSITEEIEIEKFYDLNEGDEEEEKEIKKEEIKEIKEIDKSINNINRNFSEHSIKFNNNHFKDKIKASINYEYKSFRITNYENILNQNQVYEIYKSKNINNNVINYYYPNFEEYNKENIKINFINYYYKNFNNKNIKVNYEINTISEYCFFNWRNLKSLTIPKGVIEIKDYAFANSSIEKLYLPDTIEKIGENSFLNCNFFEISIYLLENYKPFKKCNVRNLKINQDNIDFKDYNYFNDFNKLYILNLPKNFKNINNYKNNTIKIINLKKGIKKIEDKCFNNWFSLSFITLQNSLEEIGKYSFSYTDLQIIVFPNSLIKIDNYSFYCCKNLKYVYFGKSLEIIGEKAFYETGLLEVEFNSNITIYSNTFKNLYNNKINFKGIPPIIKLIE